MGVLRSGFFGFLLEVFFNLFWEKSLQLPEDFSPVRHGHIPFSGNVSRSKIEDFFKRRFGFEHLPGLRGLADLTIESFNGVGGVDDFSQIRGILEVGREIAPILTPASHADGVGLLPLRFQAGEMLFRDFQCRCLIYVLEIRHELFGILAAYVLHGISYLVYYAALYGHAREDIPDGGSKTREPVDTGNANIRYSSAREIVAYLLPERGGLAVPDIEPEHVLVPFGVNAHDEVGSPAFHFGILPYLEMHGIEVDDGIERFQRPPLPLGYEGKDGVRDIAHEVGRYFSPVNVPQVGLDVPGGKPEPVHVDNLVFYLEGPGLELGHDLRFEFPTAISRDFDLGDSRFGEDAFSISAVSGVSRVVPFLVVLLITEMGIHFCLEHLLYERTREILQESSQFAVGTHFRDDLVYGESAHGIFVEFEWERGIWAIL